MGDETEMTYEQITSALEYATGLAMSVAALWILWRAFNIYLGRAIDERIEHRCRMLMAELLAEALKNSEPQKSIGRQERNTSSGDAALALRRDTRVRRDDGTVSDPDARDPGPVYSTASPPKLSALDDPWSEGATAKLPAALQPVDAAVAPEGTKRWTQPSLELTKPISPPKTTQAGSRAGKKRRKKAKSKGRKAASPRPQQLAVVAASKNANKIKGPKSAPEVVMA